MFSPSTDPQISDLELRTLVAAKTGEPLIAIRIDGRDFTLTPAETRQLAGAMADVTGMAEAEAFLWSYMHEEMQLAPSECTEILAGFRLWRSQRARITAPASAEALVHLAQPI